MEFLGVVLSFSFALTLCVLAYYDVKSRTVPTNGLLLLLVLGMALGIATMDAIKLLLASSFMVLGFVQRVFKWDFVPWADCIALTALALALPGFTFGFMVFFASGAAFLGAGRKYILRQDWKDYRVPMMPLLVAGLFLTLFLSS